MATDYIITRTNDEIHIICIVVMHFYFNSRGNSAYVLRKQYLYFIATFFTPFYCSPLGSSLSCFVINDRYSNLFYSIVFISKLNTTITSAIKVWLR